ncbi:alpha-dehydro-beta-deoxy-D-glucarate aldolase [Opitutaceae bacterium TAV5]|nr:alpha-dehydro-beta-deoxy-D-glucarate aldolase [Opitutaceae bacterium TAV5]
MSPSCAPGLSGFPGPCCKPERLRGGVPTLGTWFSIGSPVIAEIAAGCGLDWGLFDHEQGCAPEAALPDNLRAVAGTPLIPIVRVGAPHPDAVMRALNWGAEGIMFPHVESAEQADACVRTVRYPPRGDRGISRSTRACGYGLRAPDFKNSPPRPIVIVQIESLEGVRRAGEIAAVDGVDMLFVGPADLTFDLSINASPPGPDYAGCLRAVVAAARSHGKSTGILVRDVTDAGSLREAGFTHLAIDSDMAILRSRYRQLMAGAKEWQNSQA